MQLALGSILVASLLGAPVPPPASVPSLRAAIASASRVRLEQTVKPPRHFDSVLDGMLAGAVAGALLGWLAGGLDDCDDCGSPAAAGAAIGAGIGAGIDALIWSRDKPPSRAVSPVSLAVGRKGVGVRGVITWK
jgi:hypothetical protein